MEEKVLLKKQAAADALQVSVRQLEKLISGNEISTVRLGRRCVRVPMDEVKRFAKERTR